LADVYHEPTAEEVTCLLAALPNLETFKYTNGSDKRSYFHVLKSTPIFLACMIELPYRETIKLGRLGLRDIYLDGDLLASVLESQKDSLRTAISFTVTLTREQAWRPVLEALRSADKLKRFHFTHLRFEDGKGLDSYLEMPWQLKGFERDTGAKSRVGEWGVQTFPPTCGKSVLEIILSFVPGRDAFLR
jgi:hypothetical protein